MNSYFSPKQVAEQTHLAVKTIYSYMRKGKLGYSKLGDGRGSRVRISEADVEKLMSDSRRKPFAVEEN